ncbi:MAG: signal peptidase II [Holosporales bacterium]|nr:signal peptidase II [Holosporales bacterium]
MKNKGKLYTLCALLCLFVIFFDQTTKWSILAFLPSGSVVNICPYFNLVLTFNFGTSFGLLLPSTDIQYYLIVILTILCISFLTYAFFKFKSTLEKVSCSILIGGSIGNLLDRFLQGAVVDFIDIHYNNWHWPAFNIADTCISCSVIFLIVYNLSSKNT